MKGILIDPLAKSVEAIQSESFELGELHNLIGADCLDFCHPFGRPETVAVDDEGVAKKLAFFTIQDFVWPIYGRAIIFGRGPGGETRSTRFTPDEVYELITFP